MSPSALTIHRKDYRAPIFLIHAIEMGFDLDPENTIVATRLHAVRNKSDNKSRNDNGDLVLNGEELELLSIAVDGKPLAKKAWRLEPNRLILSNLPDRCIIDIAVRIQPQRNTSLMGLYVSNGNFFTQCEAEGFRKITYFPDRPDVMSLFTVMLRADKKNFPVLLSNGNLIEQGDLGDGRHYAKWEDPFPKPSYLFALVAGKLAHIEHKLKTGRQREVLLQIYAEPQDLNKLEYAMTAIIHSVQWDEKRFGLELDLDRFMIVAVGDFNMGAMENKGLNIFNTKYVLASPATATDMDYAAIEAVVGHEYFHNWTGNRVTCRDWFQLTLKEGLTVFRDQEFSADMSAGYLEGRAGHEHSTARAVQRIENVRGLRAVQFSEDAGPMAHPIRPESYQEIGNFYTSTVYEKGAEVIRMQQTLLGRDGFRRGMDEYFRRHDGQAVTCDDFVAAMESVYSSIHPGKNLDVFRRWYSQAGTPRVMATGRYDANTQTYALRLRQISPKVGIERDSKQDKQPFHIPFAFGLLDEKGKDLMLQLQGTNQTATTLVLDFTEQEQSFVFPNIKLASGQKPTPSLLRDFSAPVIVDFDYSDADLSLLARHDSDAFNRWEAGQRVATRELVRLTGQVEKGEALQLSTVLIDLYQHILRDTTLDPALKDLALTLPSESVIGEELSVYDPQVVHRARDFAQLTLAKSLRKEWHRAYMQHQTPGAYSPDPVSAGKRSLKNCALYYLTTSDSSMIEPCWKQFQQADNMTDQLAALICLLNSNLPTASKRRSQALETYYRSNHDDALVICKWLRVQATAQVPAHTAQRSVLEVVQSLIHHESFSLNNPNKVYALLGAFFSGNPSEFHRPDGQGYAFWADMILALDPINPSVAARMARMLDRWKKLTPILQTQAKIALEKVQQGRKLSKDVTEIINKALAA